MNEFVDFVRGVGLIPHAVVPDGRWRRCPTENHRRTRNGAYKLAESGRIGWAQDHATHPEPLTWRADKDAVFPKVDMAAIARRRNDARRLMIKAIHGARDFYAKCDPLRGGHEYLKAHGLDMTGCMGLKTDVTGWLVVPAFVGRNLMSLQRISPEGEKRFWTGAPMKGASYTIDRTSYSITALCEGLATGLAIFAAAPLVRVVVGFDAGNLGRVEMPQRGLVVVAADNDHETAARIGRNPGLIAATEAAEHIGCGVAIPEGMAGSDFCDWRMEKTAARLANRGRMSESAVRKAVDAEIAATIARNAKFVTVRSRSER